MKSEPAIQLLPLCAVLLFARYDTNLSQYPYAEAAKGRLNCRLLKVGKASLAKLKTLWFAFFIYLTNSVHLTSILIRYFDLNL